MRPLKGEQHRGRPTHAVLVAPMAAWHALGQAPQWVTGLAAQWVTGLAANTSAVSLQDLLRFAARPTLWGFQPTGELELEIQTTLKGLLPTVETIWVLSQVAPKRH